jgi:hypothetical protein
MSLWLLAHCSLHYSLPPSPCLLHTTASLHSKHISDFKLTMSDINPRHIIPWEAALGFKVCRGLSRDSPSLRAPEVEHLLDRIKKLGVRHIVCRTADQLRVSERFNVEARELFHEVGPTIWPDVLPSWAWSFDRSDRMFYNDMADLYPKQLCYSDPDDRTV